MSPETRSTFFRQSGWLVVSNILSGVFLIGVISLLQRMIPADEIDELGVYFTLLRFFTVLAIPTAGLQVVFAQMAAAALTEEKQTQLRVAVTRVTAAILSLWLVISLLCVLNVGYLKAAFKFTDTLAIVITFLLVLMQLLLPLMQGLLQGMQNFFSLGLSLMLNGVGRFVAIFLILYFFHARSTEALIGALIGLASAVAAAFWPSRKLFRPVPGEFAWKNWLQRAIPLAGGAGASLFLMNADILFVQSFFTKEQGPYYSAAAVVGVGLVAFSTPLAAVMFPKIVRSFAQAQQTNSLTLALLGTGILGGLGAFICTLWPELPLRIMYFNKPEFFKSAVLVPWFMWAMLPLTLANVLTTNLLAREQYKAVPWLVAVAAGYGFSLYYFLSHHQNADHFVAFRQVVQILGLFSFLLLAVALFFTFFQKSTTTAQP